MKRDLDHIREFLFECERSEDFRFVCLEHMYIGGAFRDVLPNGWNTKTLYHYELLKDAGFLRELDEEFPPSSGGSSAVHERRFRLTNAGHDYIDSVRNEGVWAQTKETVAKEGGSVALEIVKALALGFARKQIEDRTGIQL